MLKVLICDVCWTSFCAYHKTVLLFLSARTSSQRKFQARKKQYLAQGRLLLRRLLRKTPWWVTGHLHLGYVELMLLDLERNAGDAQIHATIRASAHAALQLLGEEELCRAENAQAEARSFKARNALNLLAAEQLLVRQPEAAGEYLARLLK